jgi:DNA-binding MarR family transcriptional regulator
LRYDSANIQHLAQFRRSIVPGTAFALVIPDPSSALAGEVPWNNQMPGRPMTANDNLPPLRAVPLFIAAASLAELSARMLGVLACAAERPGLSVKHVSARLGQPKACISRDADMLVSTGLLSRGRNPADRRMVTLALTDQGVRLLQQLDALAEALEAETKQRRSGGSESSEGSEGGGGSGAARQALRRSELKRLIRRPRGRMPRWTVTAS